MEYTALGDAINLAARMEQTATPGTVQIAEATYSLVRRCSSSKRWAAGDQGQDRAGGRPTAYCAQGCSVAASAASKGWSRPWWAARPNWPRCAGRWRPAPRPGADHLGHGRGRPGQERLMSEFRAAIGSGQQPRAAVAGGPLPVVSDQQAPTRRSSTCSPPTLACRHAAGEPGRLCAPGGPGGGGQRPARRRDGPLPGHPAGNPLCRPSRSAACKYLEPPQLRQRLHQAIAQYLESLSAAAPTVAGALTTCTGSIPARWTCCEALLLFSDRAAADDRGRVSAAVQEPPGASREGRARVRRIATGPSRSSRWTTARRASWWATCCTIEDLPAKVRQLDPRKGRGQPVLRRRGHPLTARRGPGGQPGWALARHPRH